MDSEHTVQRRRRESGTGSDTVYTDTTTDYGGGAALGAPVKVTAVSSVNTEASTTTATTTHDYAWYTGAVQAKTTHRPDTAQSQLFTTDYGYDTAGRLTGVHIADGRPRDVAFVNDLAGQALARDEADNLATGDPHQRWYRFDGREMGSISNDGTDETSYAVSIDRRLAAAAPDATGPFRDGGAASVANADYDGQVRSITSFSSAGAAGGIHTVREGDTLAGLAASLWGDAGLWYKLASANGLSAASALVPGQTLTIPAGVTRSGRTASTFKPFDASEVQGDLSPTTPKPQAAAARHNKCGAFGAVLLTVVAVAVTAIVVGPASAGFASLFQGGALAGSAAAASAATAGAIVGGAVAGAAGSIISQGVGLATGLQDKFSWKGVALAGIGGAVGGGLRGFDAFSKLGGATSFVNDVARGALGSAISQGVGVATGLQSRFDFVGVAAAGVGAGIGGAVGRGIGFDPNLQGFHPGNIGLGAVANTASAIANAATRSALSGTNFGDNVIRALPDAIGSAIGQLAGAGIATAYDGVSTRALAKATESPVEANKPVTGQAVAGAIEAQGGWVNVAAITEAVNAFFEKNSPLNIGFDSALAQGIAELDGYVTGYSAGESSARAEAAATLNRYQSLSETDRLNFRQANGIVLSSDPSAARAASHAGDPSYYNGNDSRDANTFSELAVWKSMYLDAYAARGAPFKDSLGIETAFARNEASLVNAFARADAEVNKLLFVSLGAPILIAAGGVLAPIAGAYAGGAGGLAYSVTSFGVGGVAGATFEYSKNRVFGLQDTPGGYVGSVLGGGVGATGFQVLSKGAPLLLKNIATGGFLGSAGSFVGQEVDMALGLQSSLNGRSIVTSGVIGAAAGGAVPLEFRINGLNAGRNNNVAIYNGLQTRLSNGNIGQFRLRYGVAAGVGQGVRGVGQDAAGKLYTGIYEDANR